MWRGDPSVGEIDMEETLTGSRTGYLLQDGNVKYKDFRICYAPVPDL